MDTRDSSEPTSASRARRRAYGWCVLAYLTALGAAVGAGLLVRELHPLAIVAVADLVGTIVVFGFSRALDNSSLYDPYWSVAPLAIAPFWLVVPTAEGDPVRQALVVAFVFAWGVRLTYNFLSGWRGLRHEDWRYVKLRRDTGRAYWLVSFLGIHLFPTVLVFAGCLSLWPALTGARSLGWLDGVATLVTALAIGIEALADRQLRRFVRTNDTPGRILDEGLWAWSRHPNYFGEILFWWGLWLFALGAGPGAWWTVAGPVAITVLFVAISIPMIERRMGERRKDWPAHQRRVSALVPWPPRPRR